MTPNIASPVFNTLLFAFFVVILIGMALGAYAANQLRKQQKLVDEARAAAGMPAVSAAVAVRDTTVED